MRHTHHDRPGAARAAAPRRALPPRLAPLRRARRVVAIATAIAWLPIAVSFVGATTGASNSSFTIRAFEWLRDHGAAGIASQVEGVYYSLIAPATGGAALHSLPLHAARGATTGADRPRAITPLIHPSLPGEGAWTPTEGFTTGGSPVYITQFRSDPNYPQMVAGVAWIDTARTWIRLVPGRLEPAVSIPRGPMEVVTSQRGRLLATFNSAFKLSDSHGGFTFDGRTFAPLHRGMATLVATRDGHADVRAWTGGPVAPADVLFARQNLPLIVEDGRPNPNLSDGPEWGLTLGNAVRVWRSGVGVDRTGHLIYAAANDQTVGSLAEILIRAGAVRAMQLDINSYWVTFISYAAPFGGRPSSLLPDMTRGPERYLSPDDRDFIAVFAR